MTKKKICEEKQICLNGSIDSVIAELNSYLEDGWEYISNVEVYHYGDSYGEGSYSYYNYITRSRLETDEEYEKRLSKERKTKIKKTLAKKEAEARERKQYERLKKKFEGER